MIPAKPTESLWESSVQQPGKISRYSVRYDPIRSGKTLSKKISRESRLRSRMAPPLRLVNPLKTGQNFVEPVPDVGTHRLPGVGFIAPG